MRAAPALLQDSCAVEFDLPHLHEALAAAIPEREAVVWRDRRLLWRDVTARTRKLAQVFHARGLGVHGDPGRADPWESRHDHVGLYLYNSPEYLEGLLGAHKARLAPFNVNYRYTGDELAYLFADARPAALIFHARFAPALADIRDRLPEGILLLQVGDESGVPLLDGAIDYEDALAAVPADPPPVDPSPDDLHILYTGGTTGMPKGVLWRSADLLAGPLGVRRRDGSPCRSVDEVVERAVATDRRVLPAPPLMHGSGTWFALGGWFNGGTVVIQDVVDHLDARDMVSVFERERVTSTMVVGDAFARPLVEEMERRGITLPALEVILNSGAELSAGMKQRLTVLVPGLKIVDTLGSSETGPQATRRGPAAASFVPGPNMAVLDEDLTRKLQPGDDQVGWAAQRGGVPRGYLGDPRKTLRTFPTVEGTRYSVPGDRARWRQDGTVELLGRDAMTINSAGEKVFAEEVETVLRRAPGVVDVLVVGRPSEEWGQEVVALVQAAAGSQPTRDDLRAACAGHLARYKIPKAFLFVPRVQRLPNGKADYAWAREAVVAQKAG